MAVIRVKGIAFLTNFLNPVLKDLSNSKIKLMECLAECRKQKYSVKARIGVKKKFRSSKDKKSITIRDLISTSFLFDIYIDEIKLKHKNEIKNWLLKIEDLKTKKFKIWNISFVASLWNNNGAIITEDPFKKNKLSDIKNLFLKRNTVSSFPKW